MANNNTFADRAMARSEGRPTPKQIAALFWKHQRLLRMVGTPVVFLRDLERVGVTIPQGTRGTLLEPLLEGMVLTAAVALPHSQEFEGLAEYDYEVHWTGDLSLDSLVEDIDFDET